MAASRRRLRWGDEWDLESLRLRVFAPNAGGRGDAGQHVFGETGTAEEHGEGAIKALVQLHFGPGVTGSRPTWGNVDDALLELHRVIVADHAAKLETK